MLSSIIRRSVTRTKLHRFYVSLAGNNYTAAMNQCRSKDSILQCITLKHNIVSHRHVWNMKNELTEFLPLIPGYVHKNRSIISTLSMFVIERATLRPVIDPDFHIMKITSTAKTAASGVSIDLANQNYESLRGLVEDDTLKGLQNKIDSLNNEQRKLLAMREEDITIFTPGHINVIANSFSNDRQTFKFTVELTIIIAYEPLYGQVRQEESDDTHQNPNLPELLVANYTFSRVYTQLGGSDWIIKYINIDT